MFFNFILFFSLLSFFFIIGSAFLHCGRKININSNLLSLNLISGIFIVGSFSFIFNFFSGIYTNFFYISLLIIFFLSISYLIIKKKIKTIFFKNLLILLVLALLFFLYSLQLPPGYDSGLYHIPYQTHLKDEKIIFGLSNINARFGLSSFYNYVGTIFWTENNFTILTFYNSIYLIIFFIFLYELIYKNSFIFNIIVITTLMGMPIWFRYQVPGFSLVDFSYAVFFYLCFVLSFLVMTEREDNKITYIFYMILVCSMSFMHKANGAILFPFVFIIIFTQYLQKKIDAKLLVFLFLIPSIVVILWILRGFIISGCFIYPVEFTCLDVIWYNKLQTADTYLAIKQWAQQGFNLLNWSFFIKIISFIFLISLGLFFLRGLFTSLIHQKKYIFIILCLVALFYIYSIADPLQGFSTLYSSKKVADVTLIFKKELIIILSSNFLIIFFIFLISKSFNNFCLKLNNNIYFKIPFVFLIFYFIVWLVTAPNPRFAIAAFALIPALFCLFFVKEVNKLGSSNLTNLSKFIFLFMILKVSLLDIIPNKNLNLDIKKIPEPEVIKRKTYGFIPKNIKNDNRCWAAKKCYSNEKDIIVKKIFLNYEIYLNKNEKN